MKLSELSGSFKRPPIGKSASGNSFYPRVVKTASGGSCNGGGNVSGEAVVRTPTNLANNSMNINSRAV